MGIKYLNPLKKLLNPMSSFTHYWLIPSHALTGIRGTRASKLRRLLSKSISLALSSTPLVHSSKSPTRRTYRQVVIQQGD